MVQIILDINVPSRYISVMDFKLFYNSLSTKEREEYAKDADTSCEYIRIHLLNKTRIPKPDLMQRLSSASKGKLQLTDVLNYFYVNDKAA